MPKFIIIDLIKEILTAESIIDSKLKDENLINLKITLPVEIQFEKDELNAIKEYINLNTEFQSIKLKIPGYVNLSTVLTEDILKENISHLKISINEKETSQKSHIMEYQ